MLIERGDLDAELYPINTGFVVGLAAAQIAERGQETCPRRDFAGPVRGVFARRDMVVGEASRADAAC